MGMFEVAVPTLGITLNADKYLQYTGYMYCSGVDKGDPGPSSPPDKT